MSSMNLAGIVLKIAVSFCLPAGAACSEDRSADRIPTMSYERPVRIEASGAPIDLESHVTTRCYDWDNDGDLDLLVGGGDGRL